MIYLASHEERFPAAGSLFSNLEGFDGVSGSTSIDICNYAHERAVINQRARAIGRPTQRAINLQTPVSPAKQAGKVRWTCLSPRSCMRVMDIRRGAVWVCDETALQRLDPLSP